jgi:polysaccharide biosynthesis protein VpsM
MRLSKLFTATLLGSASAYGWAIEPQSIDLRGFQFTPTLLVYQAYDDNYRGLRDNTLSSQITGIEPSFLLSAETGTSAYQLEYSFNTDYYWDDSDATNTDHHLRLRSVLEPTSRHRFRWNLEYHRIEDLIDTAVEDENDKYSRAIAGAGYTFGARTARNQLEFGTSYEQRRYHNSGTLNADQERDSLAFTGTWFHRVGPRTRALAELRHTDHSYKQDIAQRDSTNIAALVGATWDATARTTGTVRVGGERKRFDSSERSDYSSPMWEAGLSWAPRTYSVFSLNARRAFDEGDGRIVEAVGGNRTATVQDRTTVLSWEHEWTSRISTELEYQLSNRDYKATAREDDLTAYGLGVSYSLYRWADVTLGYRRSHNDSTLRDKSYKRNVYLLSVNLSL